MDNCKRFYGILLFVAVIAVLVLVAINVVKPKYDEVVNIKQQHKTQEQTLENKKDELKRVKAKVRKLKDSITGSQKKIYSPVESDLGNDTLFFTLYNDVIEMVHANSLKIKSIDYKYNPETDEFVKFGKDVYFVCDVNMELVSNYTNLGKLIENIQQYPYYIRINDLEVSPYHKDKKVLVTKLSLRLYAHTAPETEANSKLDLAL